MAHRKRKTQRKRTPRDWFFSFVKTLRQIFQPGRHRTGDRTLTQRRRPSWPTCIICCCPRPEVCSGSHCASCCCPEYHENDDDGRSTGPDAH